jgi:DNA repair photolyase
MGRVEILSEGNLIKFPGDFNLPTRTPTPRSDKVIEAAKKLAQLSSYKTDYDFKTYKRLEERFGLDQPHGGAVLSSQDPFKIINTHKSNQQCFNAFEMDTYGRGCSHDSARCDSSAEHTVLGYWNKPFPMPRDITSIWDAFYTVFETDKNNKWREVLEKKIPLRIGSESDGFMYMDRKYRVTYELLKILKYYNYPYIIVTSSDLVAHDDYLAVMDHDLASVQLGIPSLNDELNKKIEPGAPSAIRRLKAVQKLTRNGFWTTVSINPLFPIYPDGYYTDPNFPREKRDLKFDYFSWDLINAIAEHGGQSLQVGMVRLSSFSMNNIAKSIDMDLRPFFNDECRNGTIDFRYSEKETGAYYERFSVKCKQQGIQFSTCYNGNVEKMFWSDQDQLDNKKAQHCVCEGKLKSIKHYQLL